MNKKIVGVFMIFIIFYVMLYGNCYAITEEEVQTAVEASSKEAVSGNFFVWFLCAIAFMKVSQKIDSYMNSLGVSVGRTGGSMLSEAIITGKSIGGAFKGGLGVAGIGNHTNAVSTGKNGMFGDIGRKMTDGAMNTAVGNKTTGGIMASIGKRMYQNSVGKGGSFAAGVIGSVARGDINKMGTITGENGEAAMKSYFGYAADGKDVGNVSDMGVGHESATTITGAGVVDMAGENIPSFTDVEMGGGRITGTEISTDHPDGIQFAMYDTEKYAKPEGAFETVTAADNSKWYKQYATPTVEKTPFLDPIGKVQYNEKIVQRIPKAPMRKDKM